MGLNAWSAVALAAILGGLVGYMAARSRAREDFRERLRGMKRAYEGRMEARGLRWSSSAPTHEARPHSEPGPRADAD
jgi:surface antigen